MASLVLRYKADDPSIHTAIGTKTSDFIRLRSGPGCGLFGPYVRLPEGRCTACIVFREPGEGHVMMDISAETGEIVLASRRVDLRTLDDLRVELSVELPHPSSACEVRLHCGLEVRADIAAVELELTLPPDDFLTAPDNVPLTDPLGTWVLAEIRPGLRLWLDLGDLGVSRECLGGTYEPLETAFIEKFLGRGMAFVDIGANIGWYSVLASQIVGPSGLVYSIEPRPDTCRFLRRSMAENGFHKARVIELALSDKPGTLPVASNRAGKNSGGTWLLTTDSLQSSTTEGYDRFDVTVARLDDLSIERCDLLKIDIEGAEYRALRGARGTLTRLRPTVISEINPEPLQQVSGVSVADYLAFIAELGYEPHYLMPNGLGPRLAADFASHPPLVCNVLLTPTL